MVPSLFELLKFYCNFVKVLVERNVKSYISAKIEAVKQLHAVFLLTAEQH